MRAPARAYYLDREPCGPVDLNRALVARLTRQMNARNQDSDGHLMNGGGEGRRRLICLSSPSRLEDRGDRIRRSRERRADVRTPM